MKDGVCDATEDATRLSVVSGARVDTRVSSRTVQAVREVPAAQRRLERYTFSLHLHRV